MSSNVLRLYKGPPGIHGPTGPVGISVGGPGPTGPIGPTGASSFVQSGFEQYENLNGTVTRAVTFDTPFSLTPIITTGIQGNINYSNNFRTTVSDVTTSDFNLNVSNNLSQISATYDLQDSNDQIIASKQEIINENPAVIHTIDSNDRLGAPNLDYVQFEGAIPNDVVNIFTDTDKTITVESALIQAPPSFNEGFDSQILVVDGNPAVLFRDSQNFKFLYAINTESNGSGEWLTVDVTPFANNDHISNMIVLDNGNPCFAHVGQGILRFYSNDRPDGLGIWSFVEVPSIAGPNDIWFAYVVSIEIVQNHPAIVFSYLSTDFVTFTIKYIRATNINGTSWPSAPILIVASPSEYISLKIVNGNPAIAYINNDNVEFRRSTNDIGSTWASETIVHTVGLLKSVSLNSRTDNIPIISFVESTSDIVYLAIGINTNGSGWNVTTVRSASGAAISNPRTSLQLINDHPSIVSTANDGTAIHFVEYFYNTNTLGTGTWLNYRVDPEDNTYFPDMVNLNGLPAIVYTSTIYSNAKFATNTASDGSGTWTLSNIERANIPSSTGLFNSLSFVNGQPAISYFDGDGNLNYYLGDDIHSFNSDTKVTIDNVGTISTDFYTSLIDIQGTPAIAYYNNTSPPALKFATNSANINDPWTIADIDASAGFSEYISMILLNGFPSVAYYDSDNNELKFAINDQLNGLGTWTINTITNSPATNIGQYLSLAQINDKPAISCYDIDNNSLLFLINDANDGSGEWNITEIDMNGGEWSSLNVINGNPAISYSNNNSSPPELKFAINSSEDGTGIWSIYTIGTGEEYQYTSLQSVNNKPHIAYFNSVDENLRYANNTDFDGSGIWTITTPDNVGAAGQFLSFSTMDNNPAIAYRGDLTLRYYGVINVTASDILYLNSSPPAPAVFYASGSRLEVKFGDDSDGTAFGTPITIDNIPVGNMSALIVNDNPALALYSDDQLKYIRSDDSEGTLWTKSPVIQTIDNGGDFNSLAIINSNPAISYYDQINGQLKYVRSTDINGDNWGTSYVVDNNGNVGQYTSLEEVNGLPTIAYYDVDNGTLKYARASVIDGSGVWTIQTVADIISSPANDVGLHVTLLVSNNKPYITYYDKTNDNLMYVNSTDNIGSSWNDPTILDSNSGQFADGIFTANSLGISYVNNETNQIKYLNFVLNTYNVNWMATE